MKRWWLIVFMLFLSACGERETTTLYGNAKLIKGQLWLDCSNQIVRPSGPQEDIGYTCGVHVTEHTDIRTRDGERLEVSDLAVTSNVIVLIEPTVLRPDDKGRELNAKEVVVER